MKLTNKNILIISPEPWSNFFVSKHHYALELIKKGNIVYFLNPPQKNMIKAEVSSTEYEKLYQIDYTPIFKGLRFLPKFIAILLETIQKIVIEKSCTVQFDVVWNFETSRLFYLNIWNKKVIKILHLVDLNQDFQTKKVASSADICFCTTEFIKQKLLKYNSKVFKIHHGYKISNSVSAINLEGSLKACYVGSLNIPYLDWAIIEKIILENVDVDFYFIGPLDKTKVLGSNKEIINKLHGSSHVHFLGAIPANEIQNYIAAMDILLVLYKAEEFREQLANPHKMMDYLGSGKIIVSSYTDEYADKNHLLLMANKNEELPSLFKHAVLNIQEFNNNTKRTERTSFAGENTYTKQLEKIEKLITEHIAS